jgi:uncharacterized membrane protein/Mg-chelatase subunit ChlD
MLERLFAPLEIVTRHFDKPWYLALLFFLPLLWIWSFRSLSGLGRLRRILALSFRSLVFTCLVFGLAEAQWRQTSERLTVMYLLDQSESIPSGQRQSMMKYVIREVAKHRDNDRRDRAGVIVFGRDATIEIPPFDADLPSIGNIESYVELRTDATNVAAAMKLAQASFPEDSAKRVVIVTDGNENQGDARSVAQALADAGIGIDVVPVSMTSRAEVAVEKVTLPTDIRKGQPIEARVVVNNYSEPTDQNNGGRITGTLKVMRHSGQLEEMLSEQEVTLEPGKNVFSFEHKIDQPAMYTYKANFSPKNAADDLMTKNNEATAFTHVRGKGHVLIIENSENKGELDFLSESLKRMNLEVTTQATDQLFTSLAELQAYDCIILGNTPRASGNDNDISAFSDEQVEMLVRNTEQMGAGLVMIGGQESFGAGGWANSELEKAMPVDFQIKNSEVKAVGALVMMMHASELAQGNYWQKVVGHEALKALGPADYCGLIQWNDMRGGDDWLWKQKGSGLVRIGNQQKAFLGRLDRMTPGDMPAFEPAMKLALAEFSKCPAAVKHMIAISDGDPSPPTAGTLALYKKAGIQVSTVAVGTHGPAGSTPLQQIANATGGKYYVVTNAKALPRIYQREARKVAKPLIKDLPSGASPQIDYPHEMLSGINDPLPPITGFVMTTVKDNPLVEVSMRMPKSIGVEPENSVILASWTYGLGRTAVFTTDSGKRWTNKWTEWPNYDKFFGQMIRWSMRPVNEQGEFTVGTDIKDGKVRVVITAVDKEKEDEFLNFLAMSATAVGPDMKPFDVTVKQVAPGRYVGEFDSSAAGNYFVTINPGQKKDGKDRFGPIRTGISVPYSSEFRERETNLALLKQLASLKPRGGEEGQIATGDLTQPDGLVEKFNSFRHNLTKAISSQDAWQWFLVIGAVLFFADVFVRRVAFSYEWIAPIVDFVQQRLLRRPTDDTIETRMERLRSRKQEVHGAFDEQRAAARFDPQPDAPAGTAPPARSLDEALKDAGGAGSAAPTPPPAARPGMAPGQTDKDNSYTARLLDAKKKSGAKRPREE